MNHCLTSETGWPVARELPPPNPRPVCPVMTLSKRLLKQWFDKVICVREEAGPQMGNNNFMSV